MLDFVVITSLFLIIANSVYMIYLTYAMMRLSKKIYEVRSYIYLKEWARGVEEGVAIDELDELKRNLNESWERSKN